MIYRLPDYPTARATALLLVCLAFMWPEAAMAQQPPRRDSTQDSTIVLRPISVSVTRSTANVFDIPFAVSVVERAELLRGRATLGLDEALVQIPGLFVANRYNFSLDQRISIRGFGSRSAFGARGVKILLDGIPQTLPDGQGQLTNIDIASIGSIEILRGSSSSLYGNSSGGVLSLRSVSPSIARPEVSARTVFGSYGTSKLQTSVSAPVGSGTMAVSGARMVTGGYREHSNAVVNNVSLRLEQDLAPGTTLLVSGHFAEDPTLDNPGSLNQGEVETDPAQANQRNVDAGAGKAVTQGQLGLALRRRLSTGASLELTGFGLFRTLENPLSFAFIELDRKAFGLRAAATFDLGRRAHATTGFDVQHQRDDRMQQSPDLTVITRDQLERVTEVGPFVQVTLDLGDRVTYTGGIRYDRLSFSADDRLLTDGDNTGTRTMSAASGSSGLAFRLTAAAQPYVSVSTSFESPTTTELNNRPEGGGGFNPGLDPQKATNFEVGVRGEVTPGGFSYSATVFTINIRDALIPFEVATEPGRQYFRNAGSTRHRGIELSARARPVPELEVIGAYTLADYKFTDFRTATAVFDGNDIPGIPRHKLYWSVRVNASSGMWFATDYTVASSHHVDDANTATARNAGWFTADLRAGWEGTVQSLRLSPFFGIRNLFDEQYVGSVSVNARFGRYFEPSPPRNFYVGLGIGR